MDCQHRADYAHFAPTPGSSGEDTVIDIVARSLIAAADHRGLTPDELVGGLSDHAMAELYRTALRGLFERPSLEPGATERRSDFGGPSSDWERWLSWRSNRTRAPLRIVSERYEVVAA